MGGRLLVDFDAIKAAVPMQSVLDHYGVVVKRGLARCPFHADEHPSLRVYRDGYYCFSCGAGGDVINFVARKEGLRNAEAAALAAQIGGLSLPNDYRARERLRMAAQERRKRDRELQALEQAYDRLCAVRRGLVAQMDASGPFSGPWCDAARRLPAIEGELDGLFEKLSRSGLPDAGAI